MLNERGHAFVDPLVLDRLIVVQHKDELLRDVRELVDQRRKSLLKEVDARRAQRRKRGCADPGQHRPQGLDDVHPEPRGIVVTRLQRQPGRRALFCCGRRPLRHERRLSATSRTIDQRKRLRHARRKGVDQTVTDNETGRARDCELRPEKRSDQIAASDRHELSIPCERLAASGLD